MYVYRNNTKRGWKSENERECMHVISMFRQHVVNTYTSQYSIYEAHFFLTSRGIQCYLYFTFFGFGVCLQIIS